MDHKKIIVIGVIVLGILTLFMFNGPSNKALSPNILYLTQPVTSFSGKVEKIDGNKIIVSQQMTTSQNVLPIPLNPLGQTSPIPTPKIMKVTFQVVVTDKTIINRPATLVNYLFKTTSLGTPPPAVIPETTIKDIKIDQIIIVNTTKDLRTLDGDIFEATTINLPPVANTLNGKIINLEGNVLTIKGFAQTMAGITEKEYRISINSDTEISRNIYNVNMTPGEPPTAPKPEKLTIGDLKKDTQVSIYTAEDIIESQILTALRIEPVAPIK